MPIKITLRGHEALALASKKMGEARQKIREGLLRQSKFFVADAIARSKKDYLSGPRPNKLGVVTGRLRSSITGRIKQSANITTISVGTNVGYGAAHELGYEGTVQVPAHTRVISKAFGKSIPQRSVRVRAHTANVKLRDRPFLAPAIHAALPAYRRSVERMIDNVLKVSRASNR